MTLRDTGSSVRLMKYINISFGAVFFFQFSFDTVFCYFYSCHSLEIILVHFVSSYANANEMFFLSLNLKEQQKSGRSAFTVS